MNCPKNHLVKFSVFAVIAFFTVLIPFLTTFAKTKAAGGDTIVYDDSLTSGWLNWSWGVGTNFNNSSPVVSGTKSLAVNFTPWSALYFHNDTAVDLSGYTSLQFSVYATSSNPTLKILFYDSNNQLSSTQLNLENYGGYPQFGSWKQYNIPVSAIPLTSIKGFALQEAAGQTLPVIYLDNLRFVAVVPVVLSSPSPSPSITTANTSSIYNDTLSTGWMNWSWGANVSLNNQPGYSGSNSISFTPTDPWGGLYLHTDSAVDTTPYQTLHFVIKATAANEKFGVGLYDTNNQIINGFTPLDNYGGLVSGSWKVFDIPLTALSASGKQIKGIAFQGTNGVLQPTIYVDEVNLSSTSPTLSPTPTPTVAPLVGFTTSSDKIYKNGVQITLKGVNWFGAETTTYVPHGLWARNYKDMITQMKSLGFNAVRVPFCPGTLQSTPVNSIDYSKNPDLQGLTSIQVLDKVVNEINNQGMYVLLDHHRPDCQAISELWYTSGYSETQWINDLTAVATRYASLPNFLGIDLKNEPHGAATWGTGNVATDWNQAAERAGKAVLAANPNLLVFVEGIGESSNCSSNYGHFWGENLEVQSCTPISTQSIPAGKLVLSPHVYGPDVSMQSYFSDATFPNNMPNIWNTQFGNLISKGFTIIPGEWGGKYGTNGGNPLDVTLQNALTAYSINQGMCNSFYWSWNPNSSDTGGILEDDWTTPWPTKVNLVQNYFNSCK